MFEKYSAFMRCVAGSVPVCLLVTVGISLLPVQPAMAACDPSTSPVADNNVATNVDYTAPFSYTVGVGSDRLLVVAVQLEGSATYTVTGVTFDGNALTEAGAATQGAGWSTTNSLWYLHIDETLGGGSHTGNIAIAHSGAPIVKMVAVDYITNVDGAAPVLETATANQDGTAISVSYTVAANTLTFDVAGHQINHNMSADNGQTEIAEVWSTAETSTMVMGYKAHASAATPTLGWSQAISGRQVMVSSEIQACQEPTVYRGGSADGHSLTTFSAQGVAGAGRRMISF